MSRDELILIGVGDVLRPGSAWIRGRIGSRSEVVSALIRLVRAIYARDAEDT